MIMENGERVDDAFNQCVRQYAEVLNDLFDTGVLMRVDRLFEFVCAVVRSGGLQGPGWDSWHESRAVIEDLQNLASLELPPGKFPSPERTQTRLALLSYCHVTEMNWPYALIANLLNIRVGGKYNIDPFADLRRPAGKKKDILQKMLPPSPGQKIKRIKELSERADMPKVAEALAQIHDKAIRNAVYHSDYVLHDRNMHLLSDHRFSKKEKCFTPAVGYDELDELIMNAFAFYSALLALYERCLRSFTDLKNAFVPYDPHYKGLMEFLFDNEDRVIGFRAYWPNGCCGQYSRSESGCVATNIVFNRDGSINFMVGLYASQPGSFSPLVDHDAQPAYAPRPGTTVRPHWPSDSRPYKLTAETVT